MPTPPRLDPELWVVLAGCGERDLIDGNAHTLLGRMRGWCPRHERGFLFSRSEIVDLSPAAARWVDGFLCGSEPEPLPDLPVGEPEDERLARWRERVDRFRVTGEWGDGESPGVVATSAGVDAEGVPYVRHRDADGDENVVRVHRQEPGVLLRVEAERWREGGRSVAVELDRDAVRALVETLRAALDE